MKIIHFPPHAYKNNKKLPKYLCAYHSPFQAVIDKCLVEPNFSDETALIPNSKLHLLYICQCCVHRRNDLTVMYAAYTLKNLITSVGSCLSASSFYYRMYHTCHFLDFPFVRNIGV